ncbi:HET-domain-containing protein [Paraphaeosphaeria sporulosa]|uniref:HET-domain-containing protein n=1 Tax=Paraphaeosphaeria sporulosa TaxID=1460663 RepID=A0A177CGN2_9PLEO|nr:HET-domain-containing protein [Paraphaeosphaeria sporulosa]OAG06735.1 HET-domain-containing protein [Paraphaeosphaeria sporulosa]
MSITWSVKRPESATLCERCTPYLPLLVEVSLAGKDYKAHDEWWKATYDKVKPWVIQGLYPSECELCQMLQRCFSRFPGFDTATTEIRVTNYKPSSHKGLDHDTCIFKACGYSLILAPVNPSVMVGDAETVHAFAARPVFASFNPLLAKIWLAKCGAQHAACKPDHSSENFNFPFRLIDVQEGRLVEAPPDVRYIALSYVWGGVKQVMLKRSNKQFLEQPGSLTPEGLAEAEGEYASVKEEVESEGSVVPRTIREAIRLCQLINERYLWVDSLCIIQDDEIQMATGAWTNADKLAQIPKMDVIYGASALTVIAACGSDSNAGLHGIHPSNARAAQTMGKIGDQFFVSIQNDPMAAFWRSTWVNRAWTFQEFLLSRRHLIFLPEQVVFHCRTLAWCEDHPLEYIDDGVTHLGSSAPTWTRTAELSPLILPVRSVWAADVFFPRIFIEKFYANWLQDFLQRRLTVPSDHLSAFEGALSASKNLLGTFHYGLPVGYFCETLNWKVGQGRDGWNNKSPYRGLTQRRSGFPSWSWTGWIWDLPRTETFNLSYQVDSAEQWRRVGIWGIKTSTSEDLEPWHITSPDVTPWDRLNLAPSGAFDTDEDWIHEKLPMYFDIARKATIPSNCLIIKTIIATIHISSHLLNQSSNLNRAYPTSDFTAKQPLDGIGFSSEWAHRIEAGLQLQIIAIGNFYWGTNPKQPDYTDEDDPTIVCLVVQPVGDGIFERLNVLRAKASLIKNLDWKPVVVVLQ